MTSVETQQKFEQFLAERMPVLVQFAQALGSPEPHRILNEPHLFSRGISDWLSNQVVGSSDRVWLVTRLGYFVGEYLVMRYGGAWFVNEAPTSRYFGRYVVGHFGRLANSNALADPFEVAMAAVEPNAQSLEELLAEVSHALEIA
jgi:hypothetical protein